MIDVRLIISESIPSKAQVTFNALMPKVFCVIENGGAKVFINRTNVRYFKKYTNGLLKLSKLYGKERVKAKRIFKLISGNSPIFLKQRKCVKKEVKIGFDNVI